MQKVGAFELYKDVFGVDIVELSVKEAKRLGIKSFVVNLNSEKMPFEEGYFDTIMCLAVIEHVFDPFFLISEISRILKPGGKFIISFPNVAILTNRIRLLFGKLPVTSIGKGWDGGHLHYFTLYCFIELLKGYNLVVKEKEATYGMTWLRNLRLSLLGGEIVVGGYKK